MAARDILGLWIEQTEGAKFWMKVFSDLKTRGCQDILIAVTDGLKGMSEALAAVFPATTLQTCIVHLHSPQPGLRELERAQADGGGAAADLHGAPSAEAASAALDAFERGPWGAKFPTVVAVLAPRLDARHSVLRVSAGGPARDLHDERAGERPRAAAEDHQDARPFSDRRGRDEADLAGAAEHHREMGARRRSTGRPR